ncbi:MAG: hypothetical protein QM635_10025 [Microbacteriaceae bacterium]
MTRTPTSRARMAVIAGIAAVAVIVTGLTATSASAATTGYYVTGASTGDQATPPTLPDGVTYTKVSTGTTQTLWLRSDGQVVGAGTDTNGSLDIPTLPDGVTYTDVDATGDVTVLLRSDGQIVYASDPYSEPLHVPDLPDGVTYTAIASGGTAVTALRSDGHAVIFSVYYDDRSTSTSPVYWERVTTSSDYVQASTYGSQYVLLLHSTGKVKGVDIRTSKSTVLPQITVPKLPSGMSYDYVEASSQAYFIRSDGALITAGTTSKGTISAPSIARGLGWSAVSAGEYSAVLLRSDGRAFVVGYTDTSGVIPTVPSVGKGVTVTSISESASTAGFITTPIPSGSTVITSITKVKRPTHVTWGKTATYVVKVFSMASPVGGVVKVTYKGTIIGTGIVGSNSKATVVIDSSYFPKHARNKVGVSFLGYGQAKKSNSDTKYIGYIHTRKP